MDLSLTGKNAVICGSSQGIGFAIAKELALLGANCILLARNATQLQSNLATLDISMAQQHAYAVADFNEPRQVSQAIATIVAQKNVHILVNNTGGPAAGPITEAAPQHFLSAFNQHLICNHILVQAVKTGMISESFGRIINIISTSVKIPLKNLGVSNTIRGAVASWAKTLANELGAYNITVNNVLPGFTATQRLDAIVKNASQKQQISEAGAAAQMQSEVPMKRFGTPAEVAAVAAFLATPAAAYVNGASIPVDGGRTGSI